ncbi:uncharacterized protein LOC136034669 [Artemia franciscana]|uniref:uncharacterized protein LOC136034669 n=1 Tax=Artemia franciscana TaxID=6661 RepID=UPI0032DA33A8
MNIFLTVVLLTSIPVVLNDGFGQLESTAGDISLNSTQVTLHRQPRTLWLIGLVQPIVKGFENIKKKCKPGSAGSTNPKQGKPENGQQKCRPAKGRPTRKPKQRRKTTSQK